MAETPRLGLYKPGGSDLVNLEAHINNQLTIIDAQAVKTIVVNESQLSSITGEFEGQEIFTRDSHKWFFWRSDAWKEIPFPVTSGGGSSGLVGPGKRAHTVGSWTSNQAVTSAGQEIGPVLTTTISTLMNKNYRILVALNLATTDTTPVGVECYVNIRAGTGNTVTSSSLLIAKSYNNIVRYATSQTERNFCNVQGFFSPTSDQQTTFGVFLQKTGSMTGGISISSTTAPRNNRQSLWVEEM